MDNIKDLQNLKSFDARFFGNKACNLGYLLQKGFNVPVGFVISSDMVEKLLESDISEVELKYLFSFFNKLNSKYVAIRSSSSVEDSLSATWAGQFESHLNIPQENLLEYIKKCGFSTSANRVLLYKEIKGLTDKKIHMAVIVQKMIESKVAGVAFSVHPITRNPNHILVELVNGLGEGLVSGKVSPQTYIINKKNQQISSEDFNDGLLTKKQILELLDIVVDIENKIGYPCDVEWAFRDGVFYILQVRNITTL